MPAFAAAIRALSAAGAQLVRLDSAKKPIDRRWLKQGCRPEAAARHLAAPGGGLLGLIPASVGALVVDLDRGAAAEVEERLGQSAAARLPSRRAGGAHLFYRAAAGLWCGNKQFRLPGGAGGEIRHANGCVALHALAEVPRALTALAVAAPLSPDRLDLLLEGSGSAGAGRTAPALHGPEAVLAAAKGERNLRLNGEAFREARRGSLTPERRAAYRAAAVASGLPPEEAARTLDNAERGAKKKAGTRAAGIPSGPAAHRPAPPAAGETAPRAAATAPAAGAALLDRLAEEFARVAPLPPGGSAALALWAVSTWTVERFPVAPLLLLLASARRRPAGEKAILEALAAVVREPQPISGIVDPAGLYAAADPSGPGAGSSLRPPTGLLHEVGRRGAPLRKALREALRDGAFRRWQVRGEGARTAFAARAVGLCRGKAPEELAPLAVTLQLPGLRPAAAPSLFRVEPPAAFSRALAGAAEAAAAALAPALAPDGRSPDGVPDGIPQSWGPLLALAAAAGAGWRQRARRAAEAVARQHPNSPWTAVLVADLRALAAARGAEWPDLGRFLATEDALAGLAAMPGRPWAAWSGGVAITSQAVRRLLYPAGIGAVREPCSSVARRHGRRRRGYRLADLRLPAEWEQPGSGSAGEAAAAAAPEPAGGPR